MSITACCVGLTVALNADILIRKEEIKPLLVLPKEIAGSKIVWSTKLHCFRYFEKKAAEADDSPDVVARMRQHIIMAYSCPTKLHLSVTLNELIVPFREKEDIPDYLNNDSDLYIVKSEAGEAWFVESIAQGRLVVVRRAQEMVVADRVFYLDDVGSEFKGEGELLHAAIKTTLKPKGDRYRKP